MPWDATRLMVAEVAPDGSLGAPRCIAGAEGGEAILQPISCPRAGSPGSPTDGLSGTSGPRAAIGPPCPMAMMSVAPCGRSAAAGGADRQEHCASRPSPMAASSIWRSRPRGGNGPAAGACRSLASAGFSVVGGTAYCQALMRRPAGGGHRHRPRSTASIAELR
jgi:hypothetical protein